MYSENPRCAAYIIVERYVYSYQTAKKQVDGLTQAILAKAFRGELVPTEAELAERDGRSYESATQLLNPVRGNSSRADGARTGGQQGRRRNVRK